MTWNKETGETVADTVPFKPSAAGTLRAEDLIAHEYLLAIRQQTCDCGAEFTFNELSLVYVHPQWTATTKFRKIVPVERRTRPDLKVGVARMPARRIPVCAKCHDQIAQPAPRPVVTDKQWANALAEEARAARANSRPTTAPAKPKVDIFKLEL